MEGLRRKVLLDACVTPVTAILATLGISLLLLSVVLGSGWGFLGFCLCLGAVGVAATRLAFGFESISKNAVDQLLRQKKEVRDAELDELDRKLLLDRDPRDQTALRNLRAIYDRFLRDIKQGKIHSGHAMHDQIEKVFQSCVDQLSRQHDIWDTSTGVSAELREKLQLERSKILDEVETTIDSLSATIDEIRTLGLKAKGGELSKLQGQLQIRLEAARQVDALMNDPDDMSRFEEYQHEGQK